MDIVSYDTHSPSHVLCCSYKCQVYNYELTPAIVSCLDDITPKSPTSLGTRIPFQEYFPFISVSF